MSFFFISDIEIVCLQEKLLQKDFQNSKEGIILFTGDLLHLNDTGDRLYCKISRDYHKSISIV